MMGWTLGRKYAAIVAALVAAMVLAACGSSDDSSSASAGSGAPSTSSSSTTGASGTSTTVNKEDFKDLKVAAIYLAKFGADPYGKAYRDAFDELKAQMGIDVRLVEDVPFTSQMTQITTQLLTQGYNVVIDTNAGGKLFYDACKKFPKAHCIETSPLGNLPDNTIGMNQDQFPPFFLEGMAAGLLTKSGKVGIVSPYKVPNIQADLNAYALGCQSVKADCKVQNLYVNSYFKPPAEIEATNTLIDNGADVVSHNQDDNSSMIAASKRGVWGFGTYILPEGTPPEKYVTTYLWQDSLYGSISTALKSIVDGSFPTLREQSMPLGVYGKPQPVDVKLGPWGANVPKDVQQKVEAMAEKMNNGYSPFKGPIYDAKGKLRIKEGVTLPLRSKELLQQWTWPVKGIVGG
jgi:basic membrane lipoprotein Med (substrate-binding protein (PBP1-ABC) superfamily)